MGVVGNKPNAGFRVNLVRSDDAPGPPWVYRGQVGLPDRVVGITCTLQADGDITLAVAEAETEAGGDLDEHLKRRVQMLVRTLCKDSPPPRRIHRWRGEK